MTYEYFLMALVRAMVRAMVRAQGCCPIVFLLICAPVFAAEESVDDFKDKFVAQEISPSAGVESVEKLSSASLKIKDQLRQFHETRQKSTADENREVTRALSRTDYDAVVAHFDGDADAAVALLSRVYADREMMRAAYGLARSNEGSQEVSLLPGSAETVSDSTFGATPGSAHGSSSFRFMLMSDGTIERVVYAPDDGDEGIEEGQKGQEGEEGEAGSN